MLRLVALALTLLVTVGDAAAAARSRAPKKPPAPPPVELYALNTHETFTLRPGPNGSIGRKLLSAFNRFLRCHHTGRTHAMSPQLAALLYKVGRHFAGHRLLVVAGYRAPKVAKEKGNPKSPHKKGVACDFRVEDLPTTEVRDWIRSALAHVGLGWYPNSDFVHLDVGRKANAFWIDYSGPGERAQYSSDPESDLVAEKQPPLPDAPSDTGSTPEGSDPQGGDKPGVPAPNAPALAPTTIENR